MEKHVTAIGIIHIAFGALELLSAVVVFLVFTGIGAASGDDVGMIFMSGLGTIIAFFLAISALPSIIGGIGLLKRQSWARYVILVISFLKLIHIPFGTVIGVYSIVILLKDEAAKYFESPVVTPA